MRCAATGSGAEHVAGMTRGENPESGNGPGACGGVRSRACSGFAVSLLRRNGASALSVSEIGRGGGALAVRFSDGAVRRCGERCVRGEYEKTTPEIRPESE